MKVVVLGDIHGTTIWKQISILEKTADKFIFVGDYFDSFTIKTEDQINNFLDILEFKKTCGKEVILLTGNHDLHYIIPNVECSGYQSLGSFQICPILRDNLDHLQVAYNFGEYLFTHAGVSQVFMDNTFGIKEWNTNNIAQDLNELFKHKPEAFSFTGFRDEYGNETMQTPMWIRPDALMRAGKMNRGLVEKYVQIVGHTPFKKIDVRCKNRYYFIDTLEHGNREYLVIENGIPRIMHQNFLSKL